MAGEYERRPDLLLARHVQSCSQMLDIHRLAMLRAIRRGNPEKAAVQARLMCHEFFRHAGLTAGRDPRL